MAYVVVARWRAKEGCEDKLAQVVAELMPLSRSEPGSLFYGIPQQERLLGCTQAEVDRVGTMLRGVHDRRCRPEVVAASI